MNGSEQSQEPLPKELFNKLQETMKTFLRDKTDAVPTGTASNPAKTCRQLFDAQPSFDSGNYFISPDESEEPISVYCVKKSKQTCIESFIESIPLANLPPVYVSEHDDKFVWSLTHRVILI